MTKPRKVHHLQSHAPTDAEINSWVGFRATDEFGAGVGKVVEVHRGLDGELRWLLIRHRRSHHFLAPVTSAVGSNGAVWIGYTQKVLESAPKAKTGSRPDEATLKAAAAHYGI